MYFVHWFFFSPGKHKNNDLKIECLSKLGRNAELNLCYKNLLAERYKLLNKLID